MKSVTPELSEVADKRTPLSPLKLGGRKKRPLKLVTGGRKKRKILLPFSIHTMDDGVLKCVELMKNTRNSSKGVLVRKFGRPRLHKLPRIMRELMYYTSYK